MDVDVARFDAADVQMALPEFVWLPREYGAADGNVRPFGLHGQTVGLKAAPYRALQFFATNSSKVSAKRRSQRRLRGGAAVLAGGGLFGVSSVITGSAAGEKGGLYR